MANPSTLNPRQKEAIECADGPVLVIAGAGAGKTLVLTERIKFLIEKGVDPASILAVTFTNKAAGEMRERLCLSISKQPFIGTFHALGLFIVKENLRALGFTNNITILDEDDSLKLIKACLEEAAYDPKRFDPAKLKNQISGFKNQLVSAEEFVADSYFGKVLADIWKLYEEKKAVQHFLDFDDLLLKPAQLLQKNSEILNKYQTRWRYVHIDEYQDTNEVQYALSKMLAAAHRNIFVVGDIDQAIYSWRGADFRNILYFREDYQNAKVVTLEENYRSTGIILEAANALILNNKMRLPKNLWTGKTGDDLISFFCAGNEKEEAEFVAGEVLSLRRSGVAPTDIAALYRTNAQSRALEEAFLKHDIPHQVIGGVRFYERKEIKDILAYLRLVQNPADELSKKRIINVPPRKRKGINFDELMEGLRGAANLPPHAFIKMLIGKIGYREYICDLPAARLPDGQGKAGGTEKGLERWQNVEELAGLAKQFDSLENFLNHVALFSGEKEQTNSQTRRFNKGVNLMTVHAAKGLEFEVVFVAGLEEGLMPHALSMEPANLEEERRLCYVALTRAKTRLYLTCASRRLFFGERVANMPSRFLKEIPGHLLTHINKPEIEKEIIVE